MRFSILWLVLATTVLLSAGSVARGELASAVNDQLSPSENDWPWWRGTRRNGVAASGQQPPRRWNTTDNVVWKIDIAGRGYGSPIVVGDRILLQIAETERNVQAVVCHDRDSGRPLWETVVHEGGLTMKNPKSTAASSTPACVGNRVFVNFLNGDAVYTTALDLGGKQLWQTKITDYEIHQGFGSSPAVYRQMVIASADNKSGGAIAALHHATGEVLWRRDRPQSPNYASPIILHVNGRDQLIMMGCGRVTSLDPVTGATLWEIDGATTECVTSTVTDGQLVFSTGGYPRNHISAIRADGSGQIVWENKHRVYVPSMLVHDNYLYAVLDVGVAACWHCQTGKEQWRSRLGGTFSSSPTLVNDVIYATNESGETFIFRASPDQFELIAKNKLGDEVVSTPAICGGRIYTRVAVLVDGRRQERLYCLGDR